MSFHLRFRTDVSRASSAPLGAEAAAKGWKPIPQVNQLHPRGADKDYVNGAYNCAPAVVAMVARGHGSMGDLTDAQLISQLGHDIVTRNGTDPEGVTKMLERVNVPLAGDALGANYSDAELKQHLNQGHMVIAQVRTRDPRARQDSAHYVLIQGMTRNGDYIISDPLHNRPYAVSPKQLQEAVLRAPPDGGMLIPVASPSESSKLLGAKASIAAAVGAVAAAASEGKGSESVSSPVSAEGAVAPRTLSQEGMPVISPTLARTPTTQELPAVAPRTPTQSDMPVIGPTLARKPSLTELPAVAPRTPTRSEMPVIGPTLARKPSLTELPAVAPRTPTRSEMPVIGPTLARKPSLTELPATPTLEKRPATGERPALTLAPEKRPTAVEMPAVTLAPEKKPTVDEKATVAAAADKTVSLAEFVATTTKEAAATAAALENPNPDAFTATDELFEGVDTEFKEPTTEQQNSKMEANERRNNYHLDVRYGDRHGPRRSDKTESVTPKDKDVEEFARELRQGKARGDLSAYETLEKLEKSDSPRDRRVLELIERMDKKDPGVGKKMWGDGF
ncbi:C39 family peptidase [Hyalangium gracile]|uniref:C39 family peptidase n=1 Tax=Hyalangium gracile TaxID=394092 RepID=UPI001CCE2436|nr:C39 family peptidase [Hyalangium gracile]